MGSLLDQLSVCVLLSHLRFFYLLLLLCFLFKNATKLNCGFIVMNTTTMMVRTLMVSVLVLVISRSVANAQLINPDNPYQCTGYPHNRTNFHYSGENLYGCHVCMGIHLPYTRIHLTSQYHCNHHIKGTALGGWLVLEPWITPSLFYQFLGRTATYEEDTPSMIGMDRYVHLHTHISKRMYRLID